MTTAPQIKAIETRYAGCRFRSRLEARWGVFFDALKTRWQYEPQGYTVGPHGEYAYLPDFWLPDMQLWVEVKGNMTHTDLKTLIWAASRGGLPKTVDGDRFTQRDEYWYAPRLLILGDIPAPDDAGYTHTRLDILGDLVLRTDARFDITLKDLDRPGDGIKYITAATGEPFQMSHFAVLNESTEEARRELTGGHRDPSLRPMPAVTAAYRAARSARFEHGETPVTGT